VNLDPAAHDEPLLGWRLWHVRLQGEEYRLESFTRHHVSWPAMRRLEAGCPAHRDGAPVVDHECGIYAFRTRELAENLLRRYTGVRQHYAPGIEAPPPARRGRPLAIGSVSLWGRVLVREHGYRAQYAYPYSLELLGGDAHIARALRALYAVDVFEP
jgi:hypothetical protein